MRYGYVGGIVAALAACLLVACIRDGEGCACTMEHRINVCVTVDGSDTLPDSTVLLRERRDGTRDSLESLDPAPCFGELPGKQRILMLRNSAVVDSSEWFTLETVDCCHDVAANVHL